MKVLVTITCIAVLAWVAFSFKRALEEDRVPPQQVAITQEEARPPTATPAVDPCKAELKTVTQEFACEPDSRERQQREGRWISEEVILPPVVMMLREDVRADVREAANRQLGAVNRLRVAERRAALNPADDEARRVAITAKTDALEAEDIVRRFIEREVKLQTMINVRTTGHRRTSESPSAQ